MVWPCSNPASDGKVLAIAWVIFQASRCTKPLST
jgi:hypothetical protein